MNVHATLSAHARTSRANPFAEVTGVDACGAPILPAGAILPPCENGMDGDTLVAVYGYKSGGKAEGFLTHVRLVIAERDASRGHLRRIGATAFEVATLAPSIGPGLTHLQKVRRDNRLANV